MMKSRKKTKPASGGQILMIPQEEIFPNPHQPRKYFDYAELEGLAQSIRENGLLQPITVRPREDFGYELISGERRLRAARIIGMKEIPCVISEVDAEKSATLALIENLQRQDLSFFEEARAIQNLMSICGISQEEMAKRLGKAQSTLCNKLRILKLPQDVCDLLEKNSMSERHARALLQLESADLQRRAAKIAVDKRLTVAETEKLITRMAKNSAAKQKPSVKIFKDVRIFVNTLNHAVDTMRKAGIEADSAKSETPEYIEYVVRIPKQTDVVVKTKSRTA